MSKRIIRMRIVDGYEEDTEQNFYNHWIIKSLQEKFNSEGKALQIVYSDSPDFIIYSQEGFSHLKYDCVRIFYTGENVRADYNVADYSINFDYLDFGDRHFRHTLFNAQGANYSRPRTDEEIESRLNNGKFCAVLMSNYQSTCAFRRIFFNKLNAYKRVDSGGACDNNIGFILPRHSNDIKCGSPKLAWLKDYKFNICFENSSFPGYLTEKLSDAFIAGCVPIYWGDTSLRCDSKTKQGCGGGGGEESTYRIHL